MLRRWNDAQPPAPDGPGTGEPGDGNGGGAEPGGSDFGSARSAIETLREEITAIESLAQSATTDAERTTVRDRAAAARTQYAASISALETALATIETGTDDHAEATAYLRGIKSLMTADLDRLTAAENVVADRWAAIEGPSVAGNFNPPPSAVFERFPRAKADATVIPTTDGEAVPGEHRLNVRTEAVMHSAGKYVFSPDRTGSADELPARSITLRTGGGLPRNWKIQGDDGTPNAVGATDGVLNYSVQITPEGLVYKIGGNAIYYDMQRRFDVGENVNAWFGLGPDEEAGTSDDGAWSKGLDVPVNWIHDDIKLTFGTPSEAPDGWNAFYWNTRIPFPKGTTVDTLNVKNYLGRRKVVRPDDDLGSYEIWLSNFGGVDRVLEPTDGTFVFSDGSPSSSDDRNRFLKYAAYGLYSYIDLLTDQRGPVRQQAFHFGYDTFADTDGMKTTDIATGPIEATFVGNTMAYQYLQSGRNAPPRIEHRGEIVLRARIGDGANKISGEIYNMEQRTADGSWTRSSILNQAHGALNPDDPDRLVFVGSDFQPSGVNYPENYAAYGADIGADGSYSGRVHIQQLLNGNWVDKGAYWNMGANTNSKFGGTIYGPRDEDFENIETAGYWVLEPDEDHDDGDPRTDWGYIVGSYGAVRSP